MSNCRSLTIALTVLFSCSASAFPGLTLVGDAFTTNEMAQILKQSKTDADSKFTNADTLFRSEDATNLQNEYFDTFLKGQISGEKLLASKKREFIYVGDTSNYNQAALFNDPLWRSNNYESIKLELPLIEGQPDAVHPDCVAVGGVPGTGSSGYYYAGSGTLIAPRLVVTAGHCIDDGLTNAILVGSYVGDPEAQTYLVQQATNYPQYRPYSLANDVGLLILQNPVTNVPPRKIATSAMILHAIAGYITGYGFTNADASGGEGARRAAGPVPFGNPGRSIYGSNPNIELVAGAFNIDLTPLGLDTCVGDSGGPLYIRCNGYDYVAATTSRPISGYTQQCGDGGIYVRLDIMLPWIKSVAQANGITLNE